jgi:hypothetical protein
MISPNQASNPYQNGSGFIDSKNTTLLLIGALIVGSLGFSFLGGNGCEDKSKSPTSGLSSSSLVSGSTNSTGGGTDTNQCNEAKRLKNFLVEAANLYSSPELPISASLIAGLISKETEFGYSGVGKLAIPGDYCSMWGDYREGRYQGHGLGQIDPTSGLFNTITEAQKFEGSVKPGVAIKLEDGKSYVWNDCRDGILLVAKHIQTKHKQNGALILEILKKGGMDTTRNREGAFSNPKTGVAYLRLVINSYNGLSSSCKIVNEEATDSCTTSGNYSKDILDKAVKFAACLGFSTVMSQIIFPNNTDQAKNIYNDVTSRKGKNCGVDLKFGSSEQSGKLESFIEFVKTLPSDCDKYTNEENDKVKTVRVCGVPDGNGLIYGQCVSLAKQWQKYIGATHSSVWPSRGDDWPLYSYEEWKAGRNLALARPSPGYTIVAIDDYFELLPGDMLIAKFSGYSSSHVGIFVSFDKDNKEKFILFDQNPNPPRQNTYSKSIFRGAIRYLKK